MFRLIQCIMARSVVSQCIPTFALSVFFLGVLSALPSQAIIVGPITTDSAVYRAASNTSSVISINWQGTSDSAPSNLLVGSAYRVISSAGVFTDNSGRINHTLSTQVFDTLTVSAINPFTVREQLRIPRSVLVAANRLGVREIQYQRSFIDESELGVLAPVLASTTIRLSNTGTGAVSIEQVDLRFDNEQIVATAVEGEVLTAYAVISHRGTGRLDAVWEIALPSSTRGEPIFTALKTERRFLSGRGDTRIESPNLPSQQIGRHLLRLRILSPEVAFDYGSLEFSVLRGKSLLQMGGVLPLDRATVRPDTPFSWQAVNGAASYLIEIYRHSSTEQPEFLMSYADSASKDPLVGDASAERKLVKGMRLTPDVTSTMLSKLVLSGLNGGENYRWRVHAYDVKGYLLAVSETRSMNYRVDGD